MEAPSIQGVVQPHPTVLDLSKVEGSVIQFIKVFFPQTLFSFIFGSFVLILGSFFYSFINVQVQRFCSIFSVDTPVT